jgi:hypothetical protein
MHRDLKADIVLHRGSTLSEQQRFFDRFRQVYNVERPHEGIGQQRPARHFRPSPRPSRESLERQSIHCTGRSATSWAMASCAGIRRMSFFQSPSADTL